MDISGSLKNDSDELIEEFLERNLSEKRKKLIRLLENIGTKDAAQIYKAGIYCFLKNELPARQLIVSHCFNELINSIIRIEETEYKSQLNDAISNIEFVKMGGHSEEKIKQVCNAIFSSQIKGLTNEKGKIVKLIKDCRPQIDEKELEEIAKETMSKKGLIGGLRHFNKQLKEISLPEFNKAIEAIEGMILTLEASYNERKGIIDEILKKYNGDHSNIPDDKDVSIVLRNFNGNLKSYFFSKIENPLWTQKLNKTDLLKPYFFQNEQDITIFFWDAAPYLIRISSYYPDGVYDVIKPVLDENLGNHQNVDGFLIQIIMQIGINFPYEAKYTEEIGKYFEKWLSESKSILSWLDIRELNRFLRSLKERDKSEIALGIIREIIKLHTEVKTRTYPSMNGDYESKEIDVKTKFLLSEGMDKYCYEKVLEEAEKLFKDGSNRYKIFECFYYTLADLLQQEKDLDKKLCSNRSAIENHEQDQYNTDPEYLLISSIRNIAETIVEDDNENVMKIFQKLKEGDKKIFLRIILHLLRKYPKNHNDKISEYLTSNSLFDDTNFHHEYYLLLKQEFKNLSIENQNKILGFIDIGPANTSWCEDEDQKQAYIKYWKYKELYCIADNLPEEWEIKYKNLKKENSFEDPEHPEFSHYMSSGFVGNISPKEDGDIQDMSLKEIINYLKEWKPEGGFGSATRAGLSDNIAKDIEKNPKKYLEELSLFKEVPEPSYIRHLFQALGKVQNKSLEDLGKILDIGEWSLDQSLPVNETRHSFDDDTNWSWCHKEIVRFLTNAIKTQDDSQQKILIKHSEKIFKIIKNLSLQKDPYLETKDQNKNDNRYYTRAINSLHGEALAALIEYALWLVKNNHKEKVSSDILPILNKLLEESTYLETWSILGRYIPWIHLINANWIKDNIDNILPEDGGKKFDAAWLTYINFVKPFDDVFPLLKKKYLYVLQNPLVSNNKELEIEKHMGQHIASYYARKKIDIHDEVISALFQIKENKNKIVSLFSFVGRTIGVGDGELLPEIIKRFTDLWNWRLKNIEGKENDHVIELEQFVWWYKSNCFDKKWAISNLYNIIVKHEIKPDWLHIDEELANDIKIEPEKIWEIVKRLAFFKDFSYIQHKNMIKNCVKYIQENGSNDLKKDKDNFVNKIGEIYGAQAFDEITKD